MDSLSQDQKLYRKLRKHLRQIEHLQLATRPLNDEEKLKISKRKLYRTELSQLTEQYRARDELELLWEEARPTTETSAAENESSSVFNLNTSLPNKLEVVEVEVENLYETEKNEIVAEKLKEIRIEPNTVSDRHKENLEHSESSKTKAETANKTQSVTVNKTEKNNSKVVSKPSQPLPKPPTLTFDTFTEPDSHADLIMCTDVCVKSNLIVSGSRDTTLKVWKLNEGSFEFLRSFGGHSSPITRVMFWHTENYKRSIENLKQQDQIENANLIDSLPELDSEEMPMILSSSLDCSCRLWSISNGACIKEFYLYNPVFSFDVCQTSFAFGLGAGKVQYWNNLKQVCSEKVFDDVDSVSCVKFFDSRVLYAMTQSGTLKTMSIVESSSHFNVLKETDLVISLKVSKTNSFEFKRNFQMFEIVDQNRVLIINDNQAFVILFDITKGDFRLISTNSNCDGFTSCFTKCGNQFFVSSYDLDDASAKLNVFECEKDDKNLSYQCSFDDGHSDTYCISAISCDRNRERNFLVIATGSSRSLKVWQASEEERRGHRVEFLRMCNQIRFELNDNQDDEDEQTETASSSNESSEIVKIESPKRSCVIC